MFCDIHLRAISQEALTNIICIYIFSNMLGDCTFKITSTYPRGQWVKLRCVCVISQVLSLPDTLIPEEYHIVKNKGVMGLEFHEE